MRFVLGARTTNIIIIIIILSTISITDLSTSLNIYDILIILKSFRIESHLLVYSFVCIFSAHRARNIETHITHILWFVHARLGLLNRWTKEAMHSGANIESIALFAGRLLKSQDVNASMPTKPQRNSLFLFFSSFRNEYVWLLGAPDIRSQRCCTSFSTSQIIEHAPIRTWTVYPVHEPLPDEKFQSINFVLGFGSTSSETQMANIQKSVLIQFMIIYSLLSPKSINILFVKWCVQHTENRFAVKLRAYTVHAK